MLQRQAGCNIRVNCWNSSEWAQKIIENYSRLEDFNAHMEWNWIIEAVEVAG